MRPSKLKPHLDSLYHSFDAAYLRSDPIALVKSYDDPQDQEIAAIVMSVLAFGQVAQILRFGEKALNLMGPSPRRFVENFDPPHELVRWQGWYYRMARPSDMLRLLFVLKWILKRHRTIGDWVWLQYRTDDVHLGKTWARCLDQFFSLDRDRWEWHRSKGIGFRHLLADPNKKSSCKRAHLLLRWMVRKDDIDLGLWPLPAEKLLIPVDTHIQRIGYNIGLTERDDLSLATSLEITSNLKKLNSSDPVRYDFSLCRLGILKMCPKKRDLVKCWKCPIVAICRL